MWGAVCMRMRRIATMSHAYWLIGSLSSEEEEEVVDPHDEADESVEIIPIS